MQPSHKPDFNPEDPTRKETSKEGPPLERKEPRPEFPNKNTNSELQIKEGT